ncbi:hypothetical protein C8J57DRAFT_1726648 [Mycena rebaudengoi]|nr:hypothetical protein C8J57DRAFT_1726648 [Mycena rebaudengoi]
MANKPKNDEVAVNELGAPEVAHAGVEQGLHQNSSSSSLESSEDADADTDNTTLSSGSAAHALAGHPALAVAGVPRGIACPCARELRKDLPLPVRTDANAHDRLLPVLSLHRSLLVCPRARSPRYRRAQTYRACTQRSPGTRRRRAPANRSVDVVHEAEWGAVMLITTYYLWDVSACNAMPRIWELPRYWQERMVYVAVHGSRDLERLMSVCPQWGIAAYLVEMGYYSDRTFDFHPEDFLFFEMRRYPIMLIPSADRNAQGRFGRSPGPLTVAFIPSVPKNIDVNIVDALRVFLNIPTFQMIEGIGVFTHFVPILGDVPEKVSSAQTSLYLHNVAS